MAEIAVENAAHHHDHGNSVRRIWIVFWLLTVVTTVEVVLGITHPDILEEHRIWSMEILNWIFIALTIVKAYYITWVFMHMEKESTNLRRAVVWIVTFYIAYIVFIFLAEGDYLNEVIHNGYVLWNF